MAHHRVAFRRAVSYMAICARQRGAQAPAARRAGPGGAANRFEALLGERVPGAVTWLKRVDDTLTLRAGFLKARCVPGCVCARRGSFGLGAAVCGADPVARYCSGEQLACLHWLPRRLRCCASDRSYLGVLAARRGSVGLGAAVRGWHTGEWCIVQKCTGPAFPWRARSFAGALGACLARRGLGAACAGLVTPCGGLRCGVDTTTTGSELHYPARRAPRHF